MLISAKTRNHVTAFNTAPSVCFVILSCNTSFTQNRYNMETTQLKTADLIDVNRRMLTFIFTDKHTAEQAYNDLLEKGYGKEDINVVMSDETHRKHFSQVEVKDSVTTVVHDAAVGGAIGATIVGVTAAAIAVILPGFGLAIAGPIVAGLVGAGAGGITGGIVGALEGAGIPEAHAKLYETSVNSGHIIISFYPENDADVVYFTQKWRDNMGIVMHDSDFRHIE